MNNLNNIDLENEIIIFQNPQESIEYCKNLLKTVYETETEGKAIINFNTFQGKICSAYATVLGQVLFLLENLINLGIRQFFPITSNEYYLKNFWGFIFEMIPNEATYSTGFIVANTTQKDIVVPAKTLLYNNDKNYETTYEARSSEYIIFTKKIEEIKEGFVDITFNQPFSLGNGIIMQSIEGDYNATEQKVEVLSNTQIRIPKTSDISGNNAQCIFNVIHLEVQSLETGSNTILSNGDALTFMQNIDGINSDCYVNYDGIIGGIDEEEIEHFRTRILSILSNVLQGWTEPMIENLIRNYKNGKYFYSKIYIPRAETPAGEFKPSFTSIYMIKDTMQQLIEEEKNNLKKYLLEIYPIKDNNDRFNFVDVILKEINIKIKLLNDKNTFDMRTAITNYFTNSFQQNEDYCFFRKNIYLEDIRFALLNIIDSNGVILDKNFEIIEPTETITLEYNEFPLIKVEIVE